MLQDLGLVIIDEERALAVEHKEKLKLMRTNVDVLAMITPRDSAHPRNDRITGIRETSTLEAAL